jgi:AbrB family looped-hinge helix DNA binding protein
MAVNMSTISTKGQTTIPEGLRKELSLEPGDRLIWELDQGRLVATPSGDLMALAGALKSEVPYVPKEEMREIIQAERSRRFAIKLGAK